MVWIIKIKHRTSTHPARLIWLVRSSCWCSILDCVWHKCTFHHPLMLHWRDAECSTSSSGYHLHTHPKHENTLKPRTVAQLYLMVLMNNLCSESYLNLSSSCNQCPIFEPGDVCRRRTVPWHTLKENPFSLSNSLVLGTEENIFQACNTV